MEKLRQNVLICLFLFQCADLDECRGRPCGPGARCTNQIGGYTCECLTGRAGDPYSPKGCSSKSQKLTLQGTYKYSVEISGFFYLSDFAYKCNLRNKGTNFYGN